MSAPEVRAVIFDWGGTLTPWHTIDVEEQWRVYARVAHPERAADVAAATPGRRTGSVGTHPH